MALAFAFSPAVNLGDDLVHFCGGESPAGGRVDVNVLVISNLEPVKMQPAKGAASGNSPNDPQENANLAAYQRL